MTIAGDIQKLDAGAIVEFYELDLVPFGGSLLRFHSGVNFNSANVVWQTNAYTRFPVEATGFEFNGKGQLPRPTLRVSNAEGTLTAFISLYRDLVGAKLTRKRTFTKYLDRDNYRADSGTAQAGSSSTLTLRTGASAVDDAYNTMTARLAGGRERRIADYVGATKVATMELRWPTNLITNSEFPNGITDAPVRNNISDTTPITGYTDAIQFDGGAILKYGYKNDFVATIGQTYLFSAAVKMDDLSLPRGGTSSGDANVDVIGVIANDNASAYLGYRSLGGDVYRLYWSRSATTAGAQFGLISNTTNSGKQFKATAYQVENVTGIAVFGVADDYIKTTGATITLPGAATTYDIIPEVALSHYPVTYSPDPTAFFPDDVYYIDRKSNENKQFIEFELASVLDLAGVKLPRRQIIQNICPWKYRGAECGWTGTTDKTGTYSRTGAVVTASITAHGLALSDTVYLDFTSGAAADGSFVVTGVPNADQFTVTHGTSGSTSGNVNATRLYDASDAPVFDISGDSCGKRLVSCKSRFGAVAPLPYGGFPAAGLVRA